MRIHKGHRAPQHSRNTPQYPPVATPAGQGHPQLLGVGISPGEPEGSPSPLPTDVAARGSAPGCGQRSWEQPCALPCNTSSTTETLTRSRLSTTKSPGQSLQPGERGGTRGRQQPLLPNTWGHSRLQLSPLQGGQECSLRLTGDGAAFPEPTTDPMGAQSPRGAARRSPTEGLQGAETAGSTGRGIRGAPGWLLPPVPHKHTKAATISLLNHLRNNRCHPCGQKEERLRCHSDIDYS